MLFLFFNFTPLYGHNRKMTYFADFFPFFHDFLHFAAFFIGKNTILCEFADKITKFFNFLSAYAAAPESICRAHDAKPEARFMVRPFLCLV